MKVGVLWIMIVERCRHGANSCILGKKLLRELFKGTIRSAMEIASANMHAIPKNSPKIRQPIFRYTNGHNFRTVSLAKTGFQITRKLVTDICIKTYGFAERFCSLIDVPIQIN